MTQPLKPIPKELLGVYKRRKHFKRKHHYSELFAVAGEHKLASALSNCQESYELVCCKSCRKSWWVITRCRQRVCPLCSYERTLVRAKFIQAMTKDMQYPKLVTLTMPTWTKNPRDGIAYIRTAFNNLRRQKIFEQVVGGAYQIELKPKDNGWHIHLHAILDCPYIPYQRLWSTWKKITHLKCPQIDIRAASNEKARAYVAKYASKSADFDSDPNTIVEWYNATKGLRLFATFGKWYNKTIEELEGDLSPTLPPSRCPHCNEEKTSFFARDGPYIYGGKLWRQIEWAFVNNLGEWKPMAGVKDILDNPKDYQSPDITTGRE